MSRIRIFNFRIVCCLRARHDAPERIQRWMHDAPRQKRGFVQERRGTMFSDKANGWHAIFAGLLMLTANMQGKTSVAKQAFGHTSEGTAVDIYTLADGKVEARIMTYGGIIVSLRTPDRNGKIDDVVLGCDSVEKYVAQTAHFGGIIGRYANRIAHGSFQLDGHTYSTPKNDGDNTLHGGIRSFDKVVWVAREIPDGIELTYVSKDGDQGFPGNLSMTVRYTLSG